MDLVCTGTHVAQAAMVVRVVTCSIHRARPCGGKGEGGAARFGIDDDHTRKHGGVKVVDWHDMVGGPRMLWMES